MRSQFRRRPKRDANHAAIVRALEAAGRRVLDLSGVGGGCPDLLVAWGGGVVLIEVKSPRGYDEASQVAFRAWWPGRVVVARSIDDALAATGVTR